ncbi:MAG: alpha/beta hydrolase [Proteobacteria bacterium]|nr:alpha/beta hydrolase [Pseudomonadota bacterium]
MASSELSALIEFLRANRLPDDAPIAERRAAVDARREVPLAPGITVEEVTMGSVAAERLVPPAASDNAILHLHGGGYVLGSLASHRSLGSHIAAAAGAALHMVGYRLAPEDPFPAAHEDALAAYRWLLDQGFAPENIAVSGDSAGGGLVVALLMAARDEGLPMPASCLSISPWADMTLAVKSLDTNAANDPTVYRARLVPMRDAYMRDHDLKAPHASPVFDDLSGLPPMLIQVGSIETLLDDAVALHECARAAGVKSTLEVSEGMVHVWHSYADRLFEARQALDRAGAFLNYHWRPAQVRAEIGPLCDQIQADNLFDADTIEEIRRNVENAVVESWMPSDLRVETISMGGVGAEYLAAPEVDAGAAVLYLHGGGYTVNSPRTYRHLGAAISAAAKAPVYMPDYRLAPEHPFPAAVEDATAAYRHLLGQGINPARIGVGGDSAGGGLTIALLLALRDEGLPMPATGICLSPWVDLTCTAASYGTKLDVDPMVRAEGLQAMADHYLQGQDPRLPLASPIFADLKGLPPLLIQVGTAEVLFDEAINFDRAARAAGVETTLEVWDDMIRVWQLFYPLLSEGRRAIARIGEHLNDIWQRHRVAAE